MKIYLAGCSAWLDYDTELEYEVLFRLQSFAYDKKREFGERQHLFAESMLDSGAFTYAMGKNKIKSNLDWKSYVDSYVDYINTYDIQNFFELDIDALVGEKKVQKITSYIERKTNKQVIPVWHLSRGKQNFIDMCKNYSLVSIGGIVSKEIPPSYHKCFPWFVDTAHKYGAKIHALGFSNVDRAINYGFDSIDITTWLSAIRFGTIYYFDGRTMRTISHDSDTTRVNGKNAVFHQLKEWVKYQKYIYESTEAIYK